MSKDKRNVIDVDFRKRKRVGGAGKRARRRMDALKAHLEAQLPYAIRALLIRLFLLVGVMLLSLLVLSS